MCQLTSLRLSFKTLALTADMVNAMVQSLPFLQRLAVHAELPGTLGFWFPVGIAAHCSKLVDLEVHGGQMGDVPPVMGRLQALTRLELSAAGVTSLPNSISQLAALRVLSVDRNSDMRLPFELTECRQLTWLGISSDFWSAVLPGLRYLRHLSVRVSDPPLDALLSRRLWTLLTGYNELTLRWIFSNGQPAQVRTELKDCPAAVQSLCIEGGGLSYPLAGPFLHSLEVLRMQDCNFSFGMPAIFKAAIRLRHLDLGSWHEGVDLSDADVAVLSGMPALRTLRLGKPADVDKHAWDVRVARLQQACLAQGHAALAVVE